MVVWGLVLRSSLVVGVMMVAVVVEVVVVIFYNFYFPLVLWP